jgi:hypothetical protein
MGTQDSLNESLGATVERLHLQLDTALNRSLDLHHSGASEEAVLAETAVAVGAAKALEVLTGETWEAQMERRESVLAASGRMPASEPAGERRRWLRRKPS